MAREKVELTDTMKDVVMKMSEGNPGALNVISQIQQTEDGHYWLFDLLHFDDMNIRGSQLWYAYKDVFGCDIGLLIKAARDRDEELVEKLNSSGLFEEKAVVSGASYK